MEIITVARQIFVNKSKTIYFNTLSCRCVADNTQICLEHKVIKAQSPMDATPRPSQE